LAITELFSTRQKKLRGEVSDVYQYDVIGTRLKTQIIHIVRDTLGEEYYYNTVGAKGCNEPSYGFYEYIHKTLCREYGLFTLKEYEDSNFKAVFDTFLTSTDVEFNLDVIELSFKVIDNGVRRNLNREHQHPDEAIRDLNYRFKAAGVGYQFESGEIIKIDSQFVHSEVVKPVLQLLGKEQMYSGANDEFLSAHEHYRHKKYKECLVDCLKSFESVMKAICDKRDWTYKNTDNAGRLINVCFTNNLIPSYMQSQFESLKQLLISGVPTIRNKKGGHGQGTNISEVSEHLASYILHLTATNLLFLSKCETDLG